MTIPDLPNFFMLLTSNDAMMTPTDAASGGTGRFERSIIETLDDMRRRHLLTPDQHAQIGAWVAGSRSPELIMAMPAHLWRALELASVLMNVDADLTQPPALDAGIR